MTELGFSCLLEFQGQGTSPVMKQILQDFQARSRQPVTQNGEIPESLAQLDKSVIRRLRDRGYGLNAARRAVMNTGNQGYNAALTWAVSHFSDVDFDSPIYFLRSDNSIHVEQLLIAMADTLLRSVQNHGIISYRADEATNDIIDVTEEATTKQFKASKKRIATKISCPPSPFASPLKLDRLSLTNATTVAEGTEQTEVVVSQETPVAVSKLLDTTTTSLAQEAADKYSMNTIVEENMKVTAARSSQSSESLSSVEGSLSSRVDVKIQLNLGKARFKTQKLDPEERKRLALEGKRLLIAARARKQNVFEPPTSITTPIHHPSL